MKETLYLNQAPMANVTETLLMVLVLLFLCYVVKLAFFDDNDD